MMRSDEVFSVYIVEDEPSVRKSLGALLKSHGYKAIPCETAEQFLESYDPAIDACMILDLRLPGLSGIELLTRMAEMNINLPTIVLTAHGDVPVFMAHGTADEVVQLRYGEQSRAAPSMAE